ncbi:MAG: LptF/LptG family permease [Panacagrimonas sp.]
MTGVLAAYLRRRVGVQTLALLVVLTALMQVLELLDVTTDILDRDLGAAGLLKYALLRTPSEIVVALPLAVLLGAMSSLYALARSQEIVAIRCAGVSLKRLLVILLPVPLMLALMQFALTQTLVPMTETALKSWWDATAPPDESPPDPRWVRTRDGPVSFDRSSVDGRRLEGVRIYLRGADGQFSSRIAADRAEWNEGEWQLHGIEHLRVSEDVPDRSTETSRVWSVNLRPDDVARLDVVQPHLSSIILVDLIAGERAGSQPLSYYQTVLFRSFTAPLGAFIMFLLALPAASAMTRRGGSGALLVALALGLGFLLCDGIMSAFGTSGRVPAAVAALVAPLLFAVIGLSQLHSRDRI